MQVAGMAEVPAERNQKRNVKEKSGAELRTSCCTMRTPWTLGLKA
jgi:hypothetical protein